ncbi:hypothetical protein EDB85DRAFT_1892809 [Lactarius pseudohatsudake]|nr:hypothetical protein EDB85DRAFT_1892809 [Lactarius pseudohatsudake]
MVAIAKVLIVTTSVVVTAAAATTVATADLAIDILVAANPVVIAVIIVTTVVVVAAIFVAVAVVVVMSSLSRSFLSLSPHGSRVVRCHTHSITASGCSGEVAVEAAGAMTWQWGIMGSVRQCVGDGTGSMRWRATSGVAVTSRAGRCAREGDGSGVVAAVVLHRLKVRWKEKGRKKNLSKSLWSQVGMAAAGRGGWVHHPRKAGMADALVGFGSAWKRLTSQKQVALFVDWPDRGNRFSHSDNQPTQPPPPTPYSTTATIRNIDTIFFGATAPVIIIATHSCHRIGLMTCGPATHVHKIDRHVTATTTAPEGQFMTCRSQQQWQSRRRCTDDDDAITTATKTGMTGTMKAMAVAEQ